MTNFSHAQSKKGKGKYPSLLWEITGKNLKKPSYLFGTMHVSSKMVFHLSDSFYHAIKAADVVALETNPENWQDDFTNSKYRNIGNGINLKGAPGNGSGVEMLNDFLSISTFAVHKYERGIATALSAQPEIINNLLYRNFAGAEDFEEDTFLDMYIFQAGKKLGKKVTGVENFEESERLVMEAYRDAAKDHNTKRRSYDYSDNYADPQKLQDAYRKGDLDMLDSLNKLNTYSDAFEEKFLYKRNDIQASSIDSIIKSGSSLFVGVGAAHLPGTRGVIEWLRKHGYTLRPVLMGERDSNQKDQVDKIRIALNFNRRWAEDSAFSVELPGKLYRFSPLQFINQLQFADMINGAYYMVTRLKTNSALWGQDINVVNKKVDSLLYENVPGKIISKKEITVNGYKGFDITNKTRRGDSQRYNIIITPFEIFVFKMSGNGEFVTTGDEAKKFFESIHIKTRKSGDWVNYTPPYGGFSVLMPAPPVLNKVYSGGTNRFEYAAVDEKDGSNYLIMKTDVHNISFIEEDTFDLNLLDESFASSSFIDKAISRKLSMYKGYPSLDVKYKHKDGSVTQARYIIQGPHYYALLAHGKKEAENHTVFLNSFSITPFKYPAVKLRVDTSLGITVNSPLYPDNKDGMQSWMQELIPGYEEYGDNINPDFPSSYKMITVGNDTAGEKIMAMYYKIPKYQYFKDSSAFWDKGEMVLHDSDFIYRKFEKQNLPGGAVSYNIQLLDTNSSRTILGKVFYRDGVVHLVTTLTDTLTPPSSLITNFFATFKPSDTIKGYSPFVKKSTIFLADYYSTDSATKKKAVKYLGNIFFDSTDIPEIKKAIQQLSWKDKDYLNLKKDWIDHLGKMKDSSVSYYLKDLYRAGGDTVELQDRILETLLSQQTTASYRLFKEIMLEEPPVIENNNYNNNMRNGRTNFGVSPMKRYYKNNLFDYLYDSAQLTKTLFPEFLVLLTLDDYKPKMMNLLSNLV
ncbi:MAG: TraB/GumN family protein, partial [Sphingobacteriales bacterium]